MARALIVVDFQEDFTPGGALGVPDGDAIAPRLNALAGSEAFALVVATRDWHPPHHSSFVERGGPWPVHCVQGTPGAELHPALDRSRLDLVVDKGLDDATEGYSGFDGTGLGDELRSRGVHALTVVGLAQDYCVLHTAIEGAGEGFAVRVETGATRPVEVEPGDGERALQRMRDAGVELA